VAADEVWLSTAYRRPIVTISLHYDVNEDEAPMFRAAEDIFRSFDGRPHWGKVNYLDGDELADIHPRWEDWWSVRDTLDPEGVFLNDYLLNVRP
jgi:FAD/FMN-containing dehydrogenase